MLESLSPEPSTNLFLSSPQSVMYLIQQGGPIVALLSLLAVTALIIFLLKTLQYLRSGLLISVARHEAFFDDIFILIVQQQLGSALQSLQTKHGPIAQLLTLGLSLQQHNPQLSSVLLREELSRVANLNLQTLRSKLRLLELIASLSPLLGLLGTVIGMIAAFKAMQAAGAQVDPATLSGGIWEALLTTAAGLIVAIPTAAGLTWLERKVERYQVQVDSALSRLFTCHLYRDDDNPSIQDTEPQATQVVRSNDGWITD